MARTALVTGSATRVRDVAAALEKAGLAVISVVDGESVSDACTAISPASLTCYVQLPRETTVQGPSLIDRVRQFLAEGLLTRFETAALIFPLLGHEACVVLVAGNVPGAATPDDRHARIDLLRVLGRAIMAESAGADVRAVVVGYERSADEIAEIAVHRGDDRGWRQARVEALPSDLNYADWQREVLSMTMTEE